MHPVKKGEIAVEEDFNQLNPEEIAELFYFTNSSLAEFDKESAASLPHDLTPFKTGLENKP